MCRGSVVVEQKRKYMTVNLSLIVGHIKESGKRLLLGVHARGAEGAED